MAETPVPKLIFEGRCPDCGTRRAELPAPLPKVGDDFDWAARDYDSIRINMLEELAARFPERERWTPADMEVVMVEVLATVLDQLSDMLDRVAAETYLETARRPESVRRLLQFIGYDAALLAGFTDDPADEPGAQAAAQKLDAFWTENPTQMEYARRAGPRAVRTQHRMVTVEDYTHRLGEHPLVLRAAARSEWSGSWTTLRVPVILIWVQVSLDEQVEYAEEMKAAISAFHQQRGIQAPDWKSDVQPTPRTILRSYIDAYRMAGQEVILEDAKPVGIVMFLSIQVAERYFHSEVRRAVETALSREAGGLFEPSRLRFGEDVHASNIFEALMGLDGVQNVCLQRFKRFGSRYPDQSQRGRIGLSGLEIAVCDNDANQPHRGYYRLSLHGGRRG